MSQSKHDPHGDAMDALVNHVESAINETVVEMIPHLSERFGLPPELVVAAAQKASILAGVFVFTGLRGFEHLRGKYELAACDLMVQACDDLAIPEDNRD